MKPNTTENTSGLSLTDIQANPSLLVKTLQDPNKALALLKYLFNLEYLQSINIILVIVSRLQQIIPVFIAKSAGQLAILTWILNFGGAAGNKQKDLKNKKKISTCTPLFLFFFT